MHMTRMLMTWRCMRRIKMRRRQAVVRHHHTCHRRAVIGPLNRLIIMKIDPGRNQAGKHRVQSPTIKTIQAATNPTARLNLRSRLRTSSPHPNCRRISSVSAK